MSDSSSLLRQIQRLTLEVNTMKTARDLCLRGWDLESKRVHKLQRSNAALRGVITKLKRRLNDAR